MLTTNCCLYNPLSQKASSGGNFHSDEINQKLTVVKFFSLTAWKNNVRQKYGLGYDIYMPEVHENIA